MPAPRSSRSRAGQSEPAGRRSPGPAQPAGLGERLIPTPVGFSSEVKQKAARAERAWEAATGLVGAAGATGTAVIAAGVAIPPLAPFLGLVAAGSFYFKLRAKWAKEDPPRPDFEVATEYRPPMLDLMPVMPAGPVPAGAGVPSLLHAAGASLEATVLCVERAMGAATAAQATADEPVRAALAARLREAHEHARRTEMLTTGLRAEWEHIVRLSVQAVPSQQVWKTGFAGRSFAEVVDKRDLARLVATGVDERYLNFSLPAEHPVPADKATPGGPSESGAYEVLEEAGVAAEELGSSIREWAWEATLRSNAEV